MWSRIFFSFALVGFLGSAACAQSDEKPLDSRDWRWVGSLAAGSVWARAGDTQTFYLAPQLENTYSAEKSSDALASGEIFIGVQKILSPSWLGQLGLAAATTGGARLQGEIWEDADPQFNNYSYQYKVKNTRLSLKGKAILDKGVWVMPWISASLGVGFNRAYDYSSTPLIFQAISKPDFASQTQTAFSYTLGAGLDKSINEHWLVGLSYEFADWGQSELGRASGQTMHSGLSLNHLYTNGVLLNLTYLP